MPQSGAFEHIYDGFFDVVIIGIRNLGPRDKDQIDSGFTRAKLTDDFTEASLDGVASHRAAHPLADGVAGAHGVQIIGRVAEDDEIVRPPLADIGYARKIRTPTQTRVGRSGHGGAARR